MQNAPIRTHSRKTFAIGWITIVLTCTLAFALASMPLHYLHPDAPRIDVVDATATAAPSD